MHNKVTIIIIVDTSLNMFRCSDKWFDYKLERGGGREKDEIPDKLVPNELNDESYNNLCL